MKSLSSHFLYCNFSENVVILKKNINFYMKFFYTVIEILIKMFSSFDCLCDLERVQVISLKSQNLTIC